MSKTRLYIENIKTKYPDFLIKDILLNQDGQNNDILIINKEFVFRFPKYQQGIFDLKKETDFLCKIQNDISLDIPHPIYVNLDDEKVGQVFVGYRLIKGESLKKQLFDTICEKEYIANDLANFLKEFHSLNIDEVLESLNISNDYYEKWNKLYIQISKTLFEYMRKEARLIVEKSFEKYLSNSKNFNFKPTIIHGDFGPSNIIYNRESRRISGIIDFGEVEIGDPANDFASLMGPFGYGESFLKLFSQTYPEAELFLERARFYASTFALQEALFGIENNDKEAFDEGIEMYR